MLQSINHQLCSLGLASRLGWQPNPIPESLCHLGQQALARLVLLLGLPALARLVGPVPREAPARPVLLLGRVESCRCSPHKKHKERLLMVGLVN